MEALHSIDLPRWTQDVPVLCEVCGWPPGAVRGRLSPESPLGALPSLAFLARLLAAPHWFLLVDQWPRMPTFSARHTRFFPLALLGDGHSPPIRGVSSAPCSAGFRTVVPICRASVQFPLSESLDAEHSMSFKFTFVCSSVVPRVMGKYGPPSNNPILGKANSYSWEVARYPMGCRLIQTHPLPFIP